jgi:hypothetical protein
MSKSISISISTLGREEDGEEPEGGGGGEGVGVLLGGNSIDLEILYRCASCPSIIILAGNRLL